MTSPGSQRSSSSSSEELQIYAQVLPYYHPYLKNLEQVTAVMKKYIDIDGSFLLRNSFRRVGVLAVSVLHKSGEKPGIKHFNINQNSGSFFLQDKAFSTLQNLVTFYSHEDVPNVEGFKGVKLLNPIVHVDSSLLEANNNHSDTTVNGIPVSRLPSRNSDSSLTSIGSSPSSPPGGTRQTRSTSHPPELPRRNTDFGLGSDVANRLLNGTTGRKDSISSIGSATPPRKFSLDSMPYSPHAQFEVRTRNTSESSLGEAIPENAELSDEILLPVSTRDKKENRKGGIFNIFNRKGKEGKVSRDAVVSEPVPERPPAPPPRDGNRCRSVPPNTNGYAQVRDLSMDMTEELIKQLRIQEDFHGLECCECGILLEETPLPLYWSVHRSREVHSYGRLFFTGPNKETRWDLPLEVAIKLSAEQQDTIARLKEESLDYTQRASGIKQPARQTRSSPSDPVNMNNEMAKSPTSLHSSRSSSSSGISVGRNSRNSDTDRTSGMTENEEVFW